MSNPSQPSLFDQIQARTDLYQTFSHKGIYEDEERLKLETRYAPLFSEDKRFNRKLVSFQANKGEIVHGWIKYKEGFSSQLVDTLIKEFKIKPGERILDPFAGSATTLLVAKVNGINADGIELLPNCHLSWEAKSRFSKYDLAELKQLLIDIVNIEPEDTGKPFPHVAITESAFNPNVERDIMFFSSWFESLPISSDSKVLCKLLLTSILEEVSLTRKDGQYLRWDYRSSKIIYRNEIRKSQGKKQIKKIDKGELPTVKESLIKALHEVVDDIIALRNIPSLHNSQQTLINGSTLEVLPTLEQDIYSAVITSPPYANRYDYTRTYALELAFLGVGKEIKALRQQLLSCTVESKSKLQKLHNIYQQRNRLDEYFYILDIAEKNPTLLEVYKGLSKRWDRGDMNNKGVLPMIAQYFVELTFVFAELYRVCKSGACIAFVNDNVRYGGEIIPVDTITTNLAENLGFIPEKIYVLAQKKGNSSQQMERFGREELRKCITVWKKP